MDRGATNQVYFFFLLNGLRVNIVMHVQGNANVCRDLCTNRFIKEYENKVV